MSSADVQRIFDAEIKRLFNHKPDIERFLLNHERKSIVISNLCYEIVKCESGHISFNAMKYHLVITTGVKLFAQTALAYYEQRMASPSELMRRRSESDKFKRAEEMLQDLEKEALDSRPKSYGGYCEQEGET